MISGLPHQSTVSADTNVLLYQMNKDVLQQVLNKYPQLLKQLAINLALNPFTEREDLLFEKSNNFEYKKSLYEGMLHANFIID